MPEPLVDAAVPLGVALGEVVVDGDEVDALAEHAAVARRRPSEARSGTARGSRRTSCPRRSSSRRRRPRGGRSRPSSGRRTCAGRTRAGAPRERPRRPRRGGRRAPRRSSSRSRNSAVFARSSSSESAWNSGSSVAMYAACSCEPLHAPALAEAKELLESSRCRASPTGYRLAPAHSRSAVGLERRESRPPRRRRRSGTRAHDCSGRSSAGIEPNAALAVDDQACARRRGR